jgi:hypothetical protein
VEACLTETEEAQMNIDPGPALMGGTIAAIIWFVVGGILYMNPLVGRVYKRAEDSPALKKWGSTPLYIIFQFVGILAQCILWAFVYLLVEPVLPGGAAVKGFVFAHILFVIKIFPRFFDMWIQTTYPTKILGIEFVNGTISCVVIGFSFAYMI